MTSIPVDAESHPMKLRIRGNSVRMRVTQSEAARLRAGEKIEQVTEFSRDQKLVSSLEPSPDARRVGAEFSVGCLRVIVPQAEVLAWADSSLISIEAEQAIDSDRSLHILIEKDFECRHSTREENADAFPNPRR
jgi:hypothetical protein